jgi:hypothetical protein
LLALEIVFAGYSVFIMAFGVCLIAERFFFQEDELVIQLVEKFGPKKWSVIAEHLQGRIGKQCRER